MVTPKTNREKIEEQFNLINKDKKQMEEDQSAKFLAIRVIYNIVSPKPSLRFKK